ncbi:MAG: hypothetical protein SNJ75_04260 [Gemmataceae bacterium]
MLTFVLAAVLISPAQVAVEIQPEIAVPALPAVIGRPARVTTATPMMLTMQVKDGKLVSERTTTVQKVVPVTETITTPDGNSVEVTKMTIQNVEEKQSISYPIEGTTFQTAGGKKLDTEAALKMLRSPRLVVVATVQIDEAVLGALREDTLIVMPAVSNTGRIRPGIRPLPAPVPPVKILPVPAPGAVAPLPAIQVKPLPAPAVGLPAEIKPVEKPKR